MNSKSQPRKSSLSLRRKSSKGTLTSSAALLALGATAIAISTAAAEQETTEESSDDTVSLETLKIEDRASDTNPYTEDGAPYKARISGDSRRVKPIAETPTTISVITETQIEESGDTDLRDILDAQPGVTVGTGENGNAFGDRYIIRGQEARSDTFVDGLRDPGMTIRESFAVEQIELTKGPSATFAGRGSTGGAVNSITKRASTDYNFYDFSAGVGTDDYRRFTGDANFRLHDTFAVRINGLHAYEDVPDRDPNDRKRNGAALSALFEPTEKLNILFDYYFLDAEDHNDLGSYIVPNGGKPVNDIPVYTQDQDFLESQVHTFTARIGYDFTENFRVENATRYGTTDNGYVLTGARGSDRHATDPFAPGVPTIGLSTHDGWQEVEYFVNQLNAYWDVITGSFSHQFVIGAEYSEHSVLNGRYNVNNTGATNCIVSGRGGPSPSYCLLDGSGALVANANNLLGRQITKGNSDSDYNIDTLSLYIMDTIDITDRLSVFGGVRYDHFDYRNLVGTTTKTLHEYEDGLWNGHAGIVYDLTKSGNVYFSFGSASNINGGESDLGGNCGYGGVCVVTGVADIGASKPESTKNFEIGTKWNILDEKLLLTAAVFQLTKSDVMEQNDVTGYSTAGTLNTGKHRIRGVEFGFVGNFTDKLSGQAGITLMDSEVLESNDPNNIGLQLSNFAKRSATLQMRYQATSKFAFGGTITHSGKFHAGQPDSAAGYNASINDYSYTVPGYTKLDLFASYDITDNVSIRLNVDNVTDENYYLAAYRSGSFAYIGDARNATLTLSARF